MKMTKPQLTKVWNQLDGACEALERLFEYEEGRLLLDDSKIDFSAIVNLKNEVEELIEKRSRKKSGVKKLKFYDLCKMKDWKRAVLVFTQDSFEKPYTEIERSYNISSGDKYFNGAMGGSSLYGNCLDGTDVGVRLDQYIYRGWKVEYCYITEYKQEGAHKNDE